MAMAQPVYITVLINSTTRRGNKAAFWLALKNAGIDRIHSEQYDAARDLYIIKGVSSNGQHRQAPQAPHNNPHPYAGLGAGAFPPGLAQQQAFQGPNATSQASPSSSQAIANDIDSIDKELESAYQLLQHLSPIYHNTTPVQKHIADLLRQKAKLMSLAHPSIAMATSLASSPPEPLPYAGITLGALTGHRMWRISAKGFLQSGYMDSVWLPNVPMQGNPSKESEGVYAFKTRSNECLHALDEYSSPHGMALGEVALWGDRKSVV